MAMTYRVKTQGLRDGMDRAAATAALAAMFGRPQEDVGRILESGPTVVKKGLDMAGATRYKDGLERCGCRCVIEAETDKPIAAGGDDVGLADYGVMLVMQLAARGVVYEWDIDVESGVLSSKLAGRAIQPQLSVQLQGHYQEWLDTPAAGRELQLHRTAVAIAASAASAVPGPVADPVPAAPAADATASAAAEPAPHAIAASSHAPASAGTASPKFSFATMGMWLAYNFSRSVLRK